MGSDGASAVFDDNPISLRSPRMAGEMAKSGVFRAGCSNWRPVVAGILNAD